MGDVLHKPVADCVQHFIDAGIENKFPFTSINTQYVNRVAILFDSVLANTLKVADLIYFNKNGMRKMTTAEHIAERSRIILWLMNNTNTPIVPSVTDLSSTGSAGAVISRSDVTIVNDFYESAPFSLDRHLALCNENNLKKKFADGSYHLDRLTHAILAPAAWRPAVYKADKTYTVAELEQMYTERILPAVRRLYLAFPAAVTSHHRFNVSLLSQVDENRSIPSNSCVVGFYVESIMKMLEFKCLTAN